ncbi:MAG: sulfite oxidase-like oxidoreductase [Candidatus Handelsmanbacteria bacterium]|nr:sulfite oxidase-like oxidoreductase [Candidatus Handelsmanbacteria bacterium]
MEYNERMLAAKQKLLERFRRQVPSAPTGRNRLPPGQHLTKGFPVLDLGVHPQFHPKRWRFSVEGEVEQPLDLDWEGFLQLLPKKDQVADFHCVTTWSKFDVEWGGIPFLDLATLVRPTEAARYLIAHSADGYTTNMPLADCMAEEVILAYELFGQPLPLEHGGPMRLVVPKIYAWKSAKFLRKLVFSAQDQPGFWEVRGYHNHGDPWTEERHG